MVDIYFGLIFLVGVLLQLLGGNLGVFLPVTVLLVFYAAIAAGPVRTLVYSLLFGVVTDVFAGWSLPWNTFSFLAVIVFARFWCEHQMLRPALINFFPGMIAGAIQLLMVLPPKLWGGISWYFLWEVWTPAFVVALIFSALGLPVIVASLDFVSAKLKLPRYQDARKHREQKKSRWRL